METKLNIAEILKNKPKGTKLYSPLFGDVYLSYVKNGIINAEHHGGITKFFGDGRYYNYPESEPLLFPSKEMRDWSKFAWKRGDVLVSNDKSVHIVFKEFQDDTYKTFIGNYYFENSRYSFLEKTYETKDFCKEIDSEAKTYINFLEKIVGGKLNLETLEIENTQPEFKDGDIVFVESHMLGINTSFMIAIFRKEKEIGKYKFSPALCESNEHDTYLREDSVVLSPSHIKIFRPATDSEKQQLFDALAKEIKAWDAEKKQIVDINEQYEFKPFDRVLVRDEDDCVWCANIFSHINSHEEYVTIGCERGYTYCLPYEGNEHLLGTTKDVEG